MSFRGNYLIISYRIFVGVSSFQGATGFVGSTDHSMIVFQVTLQSLKLMRGKCCLPPLMQADRQFLALKQGEISTLLKAGRIKCDDDRDEAAMGTHTMFSSPGLF